jgi:hypothetical protein
MAETLTYDPTPADQPEFSPEEQDSLQRGEEMEQAQNEVFAGKFKDAQELERAYIELQKKLGEPKEEEPSEEVSDEVEQETEEVETPPAQSLITDASAEYAEKGELSPETYDKFSEMSSKDLVEAYMQMNPEGQQQQQQSAPDLSDREVATVQNIAGGEAEYGQLMQWAAGNLEESTVAGFDSVIASGNVQAIQLAVLGLKSQYENVNGYEGRMLSGKAAPADPGFRSQAEVIEAMNDPRYEKDPAYRQDVFEKLDRSNLEY